MTDVIAGKLIPTRWDIADEMRDERTDSGRNVEPQLTESEARELTDQIKQDLDNIADRITRAWRGRADKVLGYRNWSQYCDFEFGGIHTWRDRDTRKRLAHELRNTGMSTRAIAPALGIGVGTVHRDLHAPVPNGTDGDPPDKVTSLDGRDRPTTRKTAKRAPTPVMQNVLTDLDMAGEHIEAARAALALLGDRSIDKEGLRRASRNVEVEIELLREVVETVTE